MARILAIESDAEQIAILRRLVGDALRADVIAVASTDDAIRTLGVSLPDVIVTSSLLSPVEGQRLAEHLKRDPTLDYMPVLTLPPLVESSEKEATRRPSLVSRFIRRPQHVWPVYDTHAVTARIKEALEQSRTDAELYGDVWRPARLLLLAEPTPQVELATETVDLVRVLDAQLEMQVSDAIRRERATRWKRNELPWLESIKLEWGAELRLLNLSSSGLLVESGNKMTVGVRADFQVAGADALDVVLPARVVRSDVSSVGRLGVKYLAAAVFEHPLDGLGPDGSLLSDFSARRLRRGH